MRIKRNVLPVVAGLVFALSASVTHAVAMFDASAEASAEITGLQNAAGAPIDSADWGRYITATSTVISSDLNATADPAPNNATASLSLGIDDSQFSWSAGAGANGQVSVPGFAESSALVEIAVEIENTSNEVLTVTIDSIIDVAASFNLDTVSQTLDDLYADGSADIWTAQLINFSLPVGGPSDGDTSILDFGGPFTHSLASGETYQFTVLAEARGRISQVPAPATLALLGLGLAGIGFQRKRVKAA